MYLANYTRENREMRRERKYENHSSKLPNDEARAHFKALSKISIQSNEKHFSPTIASFITKFRANLRYVQECSGLTTIQFACIAQISNGLFTRQYNIYLNAIPLHTFIKVYTTFLIYLPSLEFCDMFTLDFRTTFPFLIDQQEENRRKLGKKPLKKAKK